MQLENLTWPEVRRLDVGSMIVVLPTGSFEQHGPHLPFTVDTDLVRAVAGGVEAKFPQQVLLLPAIPVGMSTHHNAFPGTLDVPQPVYMALVRELAMSTVRMGAKKLFILNGHGGNDIPIRAAMREIKSLAPELRCVFASYWTLASAGFKEIRTSELGGMGHACEMETAIMLHLHPEKVKMELAVRDGPKYQDKYRKSDMQLARPVYFVNEFDEVTTSGVIGHPDLATAENGKKFLEAAVAASSEFVAHFLSWEPERSST
jgi:creatinine amidohydrolase